jgi:hypothetical protein
VSVDEVLAIVGPIIFIGGASALIIDTRRIRRKANSLPSNRRATSAVPRDIVITQTFPGQRGEGEGTYVVQRIRGANGRN